MATPHKKKNPKTKTNQPNKKKTQQKTKKSPKKPQLQHICPNLFSRQAYVPAIIRVNLEESEGSYQIFISINKSSEQL